MKKSRMEGCCMIFRKYVLLFCCFIFYACNINIEKTIISNGLEISVQFNKLTTEKLYGSVIIKNNSNIIKNYSNRYLFFKYNENASRAYIDSMSSMTIDFSEIEIQPSTIQKYEIYFPINIPIIKKEIDKCSVTYQKD